MIELFQREEFIVRPSDEALLLPEYKAIWDRDTSPKKERAIQEFSFMFFLISMKKTNPFKGYNESIKAKKIIERIFPDEPDWLPDELVFRACQAYKNDLIRSSTSYSYLMAAKIAAEGMKTFFQQRDNLTKTNSRTGSLLYKPKDITAALADTGSVIKELEKWEQQVRDEELLAGSKIRNNREVNYFEE